MLSGVLEQVSGFFDPRTLVTTFFPSLLGWTAVGVAALLTASGTRALAQLAALPPFTQLLLTAAFLSWVAFWTFLGVNVRPAVVRLLEGYWPDRRPVRALREALIRRAAGAAGREEERDAPRRVRQERLLELNREWQAFFAPQAGLPAPDDADGTDGALIDARLAAWEAALRGPARARLDEGEGAEIRRVALAVKAASDRHAADLEWTERLRRVTSIAAAARDLVRTELRRVTTERAQRYNRRAVYVPVDAADVMPTRLGNVLRVAEVYGRDRYGLDVVLIWSRLQPCLPEKVLAAMQDAKASFDLLITLSVFAVLFGLPLAGVLAAGQTGAGRLAAAVLAAGAALAVCGASYRAAIEAAAAWAEQIKAAIDLHRGDLLDALGLERPQSLGAERALWQEVCALLAYGTAPVSADFRYRQRAEAGAERAADAG